MPERPPHHENALDALVCSEDRRARVEGPSEGRVCRAHATISRACVGCMSFVAHARRRSPPRRPPDIRCHRRAAPVGGYPRKSTDRPRSSFRRRPAKSAAFQKARMPLTATTREGVLAKGLLPPAFTPALSLTPPTPSPRRERALLMGIARSRCGHPRVREHREYRHLFYSLDLHAWD